MLIGKLFVELGVISTGFGKSLESASQAVEKVGRKMGEIGQKFGQVGLAAAGVGALLLRSAAEGSAGIAGQFARLKGAWGALASDIGKLMLPALTEVADYASRIVNAWKNLDPELKRSIVRFAEVAAVVLLAASGIGKIAGLVAALMPVFQAVGAAIGAGILGPILAVAAAIAALVMLAGVLYDVYSKNSKAIGDALRGAFDYAGDAASNFIQFMSDNVKSLANLWLGLTKTILGAAQATNSAMKTGYSITPAAALDKLTGAPSPFAANDAVLGAAQAGVDALDQVVNGDGMTKLGTYLKSAATQVATVGVDIGKALKEGLASSVSGWRQALKDLGIEMPGMPGGGATNDAAGNWSAPSFTAQPYGPVDMGPMIEAERQRYTVQAQNTEVAGRIMDSASFKFAAGFEASLSVAGGIITGAMSKSAPMFADMMGAAAQGAQAGGPWGALLAVIASLLSKTEAFGEIMSLFESGLGTIIKAINPVLAPLVKVSEVANAILSDVMIAVGPLFEVIGGVFDLLNALGSLISPILDLFRPLFEVIGAVFKQLASWLGDLVNWIKNLFGINDNKNLTNAQYGAQAASERSSSGYSDADYSKIAGAGYTAYANAIDSGASVDEAKAAKAKAIAEETAAVEAKMDLDKRAAARWASAKAAETDALVKATVVLNDFASAVTNAPTGFSSGTYGGGQSTGNNGSLKPMVSQAEEDAERATRYGAGYA